MQYWDQFLSQFDRWNVTDPIESQKGAPRDNKITMYDVIYMDLFILVFCCQILKLRQFTIYEEGRQGSADKSDDASHNYPQYSHTQRK